MMLYNNSYFLHINFVLHLLFMIKIIIQFLIGIAVGIYGYLTPGYINLSVLQLSSNKETKKLNQAILLISLVEIPYCIICMSGMQWLMQQSMLMLIIKWLIVVLLFAMVIVTLLEARKEAKEVSIQKIEKGKYKNLFFFVIFNPFQLSAWAIWGAYFLEKSWFDWSIFSISIFSIGACLGVFLILKIYEIMGQKLVKFFTVQKKYISYAVAGILFILTIVQLVRNLTT